MKNSSEAEGGVFYMQTLEIGNSEDLEIPVREINTEISRNSRASEHSRKKRKVPRMQSMKKMKQKLGKVQSKIKSKIA